MCNKYKLKISWHKVKNSLEYCMLLLNNIFHYMYLTMVLTEGSKIHDGQIHLYKTTNNNNNKESFKAYCILIHYIGYLSTCLYCPLNVQKITR